MPDFPSDKSDDILNAMEHLGDDFRKQTASTRAIVYRLIQSLLSSSSVRKWYEAQTGSRGAFMGGILELCKNERDPACLLDWFSVLSVYMTELQPSADMVEKTFKVFSSYFPITVRASQAPVGITGEDLKASLRNCFSASDDVAQLSIPYLTSKLERGDGVTLSVRVSKSGCHSSKSFADVYRLIF